MRDKRPPYIIPSALILLFPSVFAFIAFSIHNQSIESFDNSIIHTVQSWEAPWLTSFMKTMTSIGSTVTVLSITLISAAVLAVFRHRPQAFLLISVVIGTGLFNLILKQIFQRTRPEFHRLIEITGFSFPSGHTMFAFSLYGILTYVFWKNANTAVRRSLLLITAAFFVLAIAVSRIYLGVHYPSDIAGGLMASAIAVTAAIWIFRVIQRKRTEEGLHT